jgi:hypothetical protein
MAFRLSCSAVGAANDARSLFAFKDLLTALRSASMSYLFEEKHAMAVLSLREAAEQARTSKVDIWRAIRSGLLPAQRTHDGDFAIDPAELIRVFETQRPEQSPTGQEATLSPEPLPEAGATPETAVTNDMTVAFAALGAELRELLAEVRDSRPR